MVPLCPQSIKMRAPVSAVTRAQPPCSTSKIWIGIERCLQPFDCFSLAHTPLVADGRSDISSHGNRIDACQDGRMDLSNEQ